MDGTRRRRYHYSATPDAHPGTDYERYLSIIPREKLTTLTEGAQLAGVWAAEALRIEAWRPRAGTEVDNKTIPQELDYTRTAVHFEKGCYKGQKPSTRVHNLDTRRAASSFSTLTALSTPCRSGQRTLT